MIREIVENFRDVAMNISQVLDDNFDWENSSTKDLINYVKENKTNYANWLYFNVK